jgi:hypothetical protein
MINKNIKNLLFACALTGSPTVKFGDLLNFISCNISASVVPFIFSLAILVFVWGVVQYLTNAQEEAKREKGRQFMIWGIVALAVMVSVWGLVRIAGNTFGIDFAIPKVQNTTTP